MEVLTYGEGEGGVEVWRRGLTGEGCTEIWGRGGKVGGRC